MIGERAAMTVRLRPEGLAILEKSAAAASIGVGQLTRLTMQTFCERLRTNGGDYLEALITMRDALSPTPQKRKDEE